MNDFRSYLNKSIELFNYINRKFSVNNERVNAFYNLYSNLFDEVLFKDNYEAKQHVNAKRSHLYFVDVKDYTKQEIQKINDYASKTNIKIEDVNGFYIGNIAALKDVYDITVFTKNSNDLYMISLINELIYNSNPIEVKDLNRLDVTTPFSSNKVEANNSIHFNVHNINKSTNSTESSNTNKGMFPVTSWDTLD